MVTMFTEPMLRQNPVLVKALTGVPADEFWKMLERMESQRPAYEAKRLDRADRQRAIGAGRDFDQPLVLRTMAVLTYLRLHMPQLVVALLFGMTQCDISRDLRRLMPLLQVVLPCPEVWKVLEEEPVSPPKPLTLEQLTDGRALVDATEQRISRPSENETRKEYYSGKKKQFTLKTQFVTDGDHHIAAISEAVPGAEHDKKLSDEVQTLAHLPDGCETDADKGYQGLADQVTRVTVRNVETGVEQQIPRLIVRTPFKKPRGGELTVEQKAFNQQLSAIRVRVEHCIGWAKNWAILATRFRCAHSIYTSVMQTICGLVNAQTQRWQVAQAANSA
jgi:hypothetical protein